MDRPVSGDDDESITPPDVTVPPWLRSGPTPEHAAGPPPAAPRAEPEDADDTGGDPPADRPDPAGGAAPNRITLGARSPAQTPREPEGHGSVDDDLSTLPLRATEPAGAPAEAADSPSRTEPTSGTRSTDRAGPTDRAETPSRTGDTSRPGATDRAVAPGPEASTPRAAQADPAAPPRRKAWFALAGVAVLVGSGVLGYVLTRSAVDAPEAGATECAAVEEPGRVVGDGPGSLDTPTGAVLAFDHAYYVERSAEKAFEAVAPSSRMSEERLRTHGVEQVAEGTSHCVTVSELSPTLLDVTLTEFPPDDAPPVEIRQRIRVAEATDGTWGIVSITPAG